MFLINIKILNKIFYKSSKSCKKVIHHYQIGFILEAQGWLNIHTLMYIITCFSKLTKPQSIPLRSGTRQGCPLCSLPFSVSLEVIARTIKKGNKRNTNKKSNQEYVHLQIIWLYTEKIKRPQRYHESKCFCQHAGKVSVYKTIIRIWDLPMRQWPACWQKKYVPVPFTIAQHKIKYLGLSLTKGMKFFYNKSLWHWRRKLKKTLEDGKTSMLMNCKN